MEYIASFSVFIENTDKKTFLDVLNGTAKRKEIEDMVNYDDGEDFCIDYIAKIDIGIVPNGKNEKKIVDAITKKINKLISVTSWDFHYIKHANPNAAVFDREFYWQP